MSDIVVHNFSSTVLNSLNDINILNTNEFLDSGTYSMLINVPYPSGYSNIFYKFLGEMREWEPEPEPEPELPPEPEPQPEPEPEPELPPEPEPQPEPEPEPEKPPEPEPQPEPEPEPEGDFYADYTITAENLPNENEDGLYEIDNNTGEFSGLLNFKINSSLNTNPNEISSSWRHILQFSPTRHNSLMSSVSIPPVYEWVLVRYLPPVNVDGWFKTTDNLAGTHAAYGIENDTSNEWNIYYADMLTSNTRMKIETGNQQYSVTFPWSLIENGITGGNNPVPVTFNAVLEGTEVENHTAEWYHRITTSGDPVIRARTHNSGGPYVDHALYFEDGVSGNSNSNLFRQENGGIYVYVERLVSGNQANNPRYLRLQFNHAKAIEDGATWENGEAKINISEISFINENNSLIEFFGNNTNIFSVVPSSYIYPDALDSTYNHTKLMNGVTTSTSDYAHTSGPYNSTDPAAIVVDLGQNPPDITKIKIYNRVNTNEANIKQLQYVQ